MSRPVVCIVGRPNVGKSTLFNKLAGRRISITEDTPGITRDRIYAEGEWLNNYYTIIDTGGLDPRSDDIFMSNIRKQVQVAIDTADIILFVVDGLEGITQTDIEIANLLRKSGKPILLVVNKIDTKKELIHFYDFFELGFENINYISAEASLGIGDLLDEIIKNFPKDSDPITYKDAIRVAFIGRPNSGKSSLVNYILGEERNIVTDIPGTTRDAIDSYFEYKDDKFILVDTAGLRKKKYIDEKIERYSVIRTLTTIDRSDVCVLVIDGTIGITEQDSKIAGYAHDNGKAMIIAVNKWDIVQKDDKSYKEYEKSIRETLGFIQYAPILFISAKTGKRVDKLLDTINLVYLNYIKRISTGKLNDIINEAVLMNQPPSDKGKRGKIYYATQVSVKPPRFVIFVNYKELIHFSYARYLENQIRLNCDFTGTPIILEFREKGKEK
ncbi:ribosome biogenesis GTPase Der [Soehngenia longivitae]|uniref:GTPase Der n=1 Tax=Soehngenia longivitae TaxID=2562294 RepID=A0A4Z0D528_9FIRM|nr:ribosome biogenesis GTPase Der [Soehngenia longivitae]TFZ39552.1 ribosome biogenesis GTPase Der [Soehngenia longivitae]